MPNGAHAHAAEPDLAVPDGQPLLVSSKSGGLPRIPEAHSAAAVPGQARPDRAAWRWWDSTVPATLAAVLCLWALKLVQQGFVDGVQNPVFFPLASCVPCSLSLAGARQALVPGASNLLNMVNYLGRAAGLKV